MMDPDWASVVNTYIKLDFASALTFNQPTQNLKLDRPYQ
jgi:hypothetical protein